MLQARLEKEELEEELNEVQERVNTMKQQIPDPSHTHTLNQVHTHTLILTHTLNQVHTHTH
jgi:hypothetical protein